MKKIILSAIPLFFALFCFSQIINPTFNGPTQMGNGDTQNNYFKDPPVPDSLNLLWQINKIDTSTILSVAPKTGSWATYVYLYDPTKGGMSLYPGFTGMAAGAGFNLNLSGKAIALTGLSIVGNISVDNPLHFKLNGNKDECILFGDYNNSKKLYIYYQGKMRWFNPNKKIQD